MKYCVHGEVGGHEACCHTPPTDTPAGPLNRVLLMDDAQWIPGDRGRLPTLTSGIERAGRLTNLHSDPTKTVLVGTEMRDGWVQFLRDTVYLNGHPVRCATSQDYVRVLGRHALPHLPHLFHPVDSRRLSSGTRAACRALPAPKLPAHYPLAVFVAKCHGTVNCFTRVRPPSYGAMRALDAMAASALRASAGRALSAFAHFLREIPEGGIGIPPAAVIGFANFLSVYVRHLNHPNPLVRRSTRHGLLTALSRFHPSQPYLTSAFGLRCATHPTDHDLFVALCRPYDISIHVPPADHVPDYAPHVMALSSPGLEVQYTHVWILAGHRSAEDTRQGGWPWVSPRPTPPVGTLPLVGRSHAVTVTVPTFSWLPENYGILHDASWGPKTRRCGGAVAVSCPVTLRHQVYPVPIPLRLDNAYTAELYTAWVGLTARGPSADPASVCGLARGTLRIAKGTSRPREDAGNRRTHSKGTSYGHAAIWRVPPPPPPPPSLLRHHRHLARRPLGPGGCGGGASCGHPPRHRGVAQSPTRTPRQFLPRGPPSPRRLTPRMPRPARLPTRLRQGSPASAPPCPQ